MTEEMTDFKDKHYANKNKQLCSYCSYRCAIPSKNYQYCSEICRLLHLSITKQLDIEDIANLIKLSKVDLIHIILTLKCQGISLEGVHKILNKPYDYKQKILKVNHEGGFINFD
jgi:hypothetical protein